MIEFLSYIIMLSVLFTHYAFSREYKYAKFIALFASIVGIPYGIMLGSAGNGFLILSILLSIIWIKKIAEEK